jgi:hypothetical protein
VATNFARICVTGGALWSAATWVLRAMKKVFRQKLPELKKRMNCSLQRHARKAAPGTLAGTRVRACCGF